MQQQSISGQGRVPQELNLNGMSTQALRDLLEDPVVDGQRLDDTMIYCIERKLSTTVRISKNT